MNLKQLQFALEVAQTRSFSRAAERCFASQPTLSNAISRLEEELGGKLFSRTTRMVDLTAFGEYMLPRIIEVLQSRDELLDAAESYLNPGHKMLRIGFSPLVDMRLLDLILASFRQAHPEVTLFFKECFIDELSERLGKGQIDVEIIPSSVREDGVTSRPFYEDSLYYLPAEGERRETGRPSYRLSDLPDTPIILTGGGCGLNDALHSLFESHGSRFESYEGQALTYKVIEDWVSLGIGAGILPGAKISPDNQNSQPLFIRKNTPACFRFDWTWRDDPAAPEHFREFLEYIRTTVPELVSGRA